LTPWSRFAKWTPLTINNLQGFFAIILNMGIIHVPELENYWKTSWTCAVSFRRVLPRNRFEEIFWMLHMSHSEPYQPVQKIDKVRVILKSLITKFQPSYQDATLLSMRPWLLFVDVLQQSNTCPKKQLSGASRHSVWQIAQVGMF